MLKIDRKPIAEWFRELFEKLRQSIRQPRKSNRGFKSQHTTICPSLIVLIIKDGPTLHSRQIRSLIFPHAINVRFPFLLFSNAASEKIEEHPEPNFTVIASSELLS